MPGKNQDRDIKEKFSAVKKPAVEITTRIVETWFLAMLAILPKGQSPEEISLKNNPTCRHSMVRGICAIPGTRKTGIIRYRPYGTKL